jgi:hypothetical protein
MEGRVISDFAARYLRWLCYRAASACVKTGDPSVMSHAFYAAFEGLNHLNMKRGN